MVGSCSRGAGGPDLRDPSPRYTPAEELANCVTHGLGAALAVGGAAFLVAEAARRGTAVHVVSCTVFGLALTALYAASTLYHAARAPALKLALRRVDHAAIFLLIAGTYTPFALVTLRGPWGWALFGVAWCLALVGLLFEGALRRRWIGFPMMLYLLMGWAAVAAFRPLLAALPPRGLALLLAGGLSYTSGALLYLFRRMPFNHAWWHLAVLAGSALHYFAILLFVLP